MGPLSRVADSRRSKSPRGPVRTGPTGCSNSASRRLGCPTRPTTRNAACSPCPRSHPNNPEFSWKNVVPPAALGFITGTGLGEQYDGDLIVGSAVARATNPGHLYLFRLNGGRTHLRFDDDRLKDGVADNTALDDFATEGDEILFGMNFGIVTDIQTGPDGAVYLVSTALAPNGIVLKIFRP